MDILFENNHERTPEIIKEVYGFSCFKRPINIAIYIIFGIGIVANIILQFLYWSFSFSPFAYILLFLLIQFIVYKRNVSTAIARDREQHGEEPLSPYRCRRKSVIITLYP